MHYGLHNLTWSSLLFQDGVLSKQHMDRWWRFENQLIKYESGTEEILDFVKRDFSHYTWSLRTLDRRLKFFDIHRTGRDVTVDELREAVNEELEGPGQLLGYRAMQKKIRQEHGVNVPRDPVHAVMYDLDPEGLEARGGVGTKRRVIERRVFSQQKVQTGYTRLTDMTS